MEKIRDNLYVQKGIFYPYSMVYPFKNDDGTWNKRNVSMFILKFVGVILLGILSLVLWRQDIGVCQNMVSDNFTACNICEMQREQMFNVHPLNFSSLNVSLVNVSGG